MEYFFATYGNQANPLYKKACELINLKLPTQFHIPQHSTQHLVPHTKDHCAVYKSPSFAENLLKFSSLAKSAPIRVEGDRLWCNKLTTINKCLDECFNTYSGPLKLAFNMHDIRHKKQSIASIENTGNTDNTESKENTENNGSTGSTKSTEGLLLATSAFNPTTLFYARHPTLNNTYYVCSHIEPLLLLIEAKPNITALSLWLAGRPNPNMSMYSNIHQVAQGHLVILPKADSADPQAAMISQKMWDIDPQKQADPDALAQPSEHFESLLVNSVNGCLNTTQDNVFSQLSGGMDSTSISALAFNSLANTERQLHSISHTYKNTKSCDETINIQAMQHRYDFASKQFIELDKYTQLNFNDLYPTHPQSPGMVLSPKYNEEALLMQENQATTLLTGNGGDEMCWGHSFAYYDHFSKGNLSVINEVRKGAKALNLSTLRTLHSVLIKPWLQFSILPMLKAGELAKQKALIKHGLTLPAWLSDKSLTEVKQQQFAQLKHNPFVDEQGNTPFGLAKYARYEGLFFTSTFNSMRSYQAIFDQYNLRVHHPFFNKALAEFSFAIDQREHISGEYPKLLLRKAMDKHLPSQVCWNTHKTIFDQHFAKLVQESRHSLRKLLQHEGLQSLGLVNNEVLLSTFDNLVEQPQPSLNVDLLYAILVQSWYQTHILKIKNTED